MKLRFDPFEVFTSSKTPVGLYARRRWLHEQSTQEWNDDFRAIVEALYSGQSSDGSWDGSTVATIRRLFGLHLTVRTKTEQIGKAWEWLLEEIKKERAGIRIKLGERLTPRKLMGLPFKVSQASYFLKGAVLFLGTIFDCSEDQRVVSAYEKLALEGTAGAGRWGGWSSTNNILRAFVVHPRFSRSAATIFAVEALRRAQSATGEWVGQIPFYQTVNALAHLDLAGAEFQLDRAFKRLYETQRRDGTWGGSNREWNTFLIVHALKNKKEL